MERLLGLKENTGSVDKIDQIREARSFAEHIGLDLPLGLASFPPYKGWITFNFFLAYLRFLVTTNDMWSRLLPFVFGPHTQKTALYTNWTYGAFAKYQDKDF